MEEYSIRIATEFSDKPGGRWRNLSSNSGEAFYEDILLPKFKIAKEEGKKLFIYLDGAKSYPNSFLDQSFGELGRKYGVKTVEDIIIFKTTGFLWTVNYIKTEIWQRK